MRPEPDDQISPHAWGRQPAWFVYYRVLSSHLDHAVLAVQQQQQQLRGAHPGLQARLMRRLDSNGAHATLMEVYAMDGTDAAVPVQAIEAIMAPALAGLLQGERHSEGFVPCA